MTTAGGVRFGVLVLPDAPYPCLIERWRDAESLGFDAVYVADHTGDYRNLSGHWFEGWTTLTLLAATTSRVRIGTLVSNPVLRSPVLLAKAAVAVDHLSNGRLDLGIGTGIASFDHAAMGLTSWSGRERVDRFAEYVEIVDGLLRTTDVPYRFTGRYFRTEVAPMTPPPVQRPRPPVIVGGQSPTVRRVAARYADSWNTHGPFGMALNDIIALTGKQNTELDELCEAYGRSPSRVRRAVLLFDALDPWQSSHGLDEIVTRFRPVRVDEFVLFWPPEDRRGDLDHIAANVLPTLR
jgi:alkanesulfonate monooxygenase SsuD/methylene tetrahydromethanopterin reductase-like flavin-dependent oxidoreductase (luciferase family)